MAPTGPGRSLHELLAAAVERAAHAQEESLVLIEHQNAVTAEVRETLATISRRRGKYGNGHPGAGERSRPG